MKLAAALLDYFRKDPNGMPTQLADIKPFIADRENREAYIKEMESLGYSIDRG